jgi:hypothetical protein
MGFGPACTVDEDQVVDRGERIAFMQRTISRTADMSIEGDSCDGFVSDADIEMELWTDGSVTGSAATVILLTWYPDAEHLSCRSATAAGEDIRQYFEGTYSGDQVTVYLEGKDGELQGRIDGDRLLYLEGTTSWVGIHPHEGRDHDVIGSDSYKMVHLLPDFE